MAENIRLEGLVLHSLNTDRTRDFYQALLQTEFELKPQNNGEMRYAASNPQRMFLEICASKRAVIPPSPDLTFRVLRKSIIQERIMDFLKKEIKQTGEKRWEFFDTDRRKITIYGDDAAEDYVTLDSTALYCYSLEAAKDFYENLMDKKVKEKKDSNGKKYYGFNSAGIFNPGIHLELHAVPQIVVPASPTLIFQASDLDRFAQRMKGRIKEIKQLPGMQEALLYDPEGRKIRVYETMPRSRWNRFCRYFKDL